MSLKILGGESFTTWLVWGASTQELGKNQKDFASPLPASTYSSKKGLTSSSVKVSPPPHIINTSEAVFLFK